MCEKPITNQWHIRVADSTIQMQEMKPEKWLYEYGVFWNGLQAVSEVTGDGKYLQVVKDAIDAFLSADGTSIRSYRLDEYNLDHVNDGKQLLYLYEKTGEARYKTAAALIRSQLDTQPRTSDGGFWHKEIYPYQMWLDGLYMQGPFYAKYAVMFDREDDLDDVVNQFKLAYEHTYDEKTGLNRHAWDEKHVQPWADKETGHSKHAWGRAMGWYCAALCDTLEVFPQTHPGYNILKDIFTRLADTIAREQDEKTHVWMQVMDAKDRAGNYFEASCSSMFTYALKKGVRLGLLDKAKFDDVTRKAYAGIIDQFIQIVNGNAVVTKICEVAGLGNKTNREGTFAYYMSEPIITGDLKGVGAFIQAACEMEGR